MLAKLSLFIDNRIANTSRHILILSIVLFNLASSLIFSILIAPLVGDNASGFTTDNIWVEITVAILVAPLLETLLYFTIPHLFYQKYKFDKRYLFAVSALLFGISHYYSILYMFDTALTGFTWAWLYFVSETKKQSGFLNVSLAHALFNGAMITLAVL